MSLLEIKNLHVDIDGKKILNGLDLTVNPGEVHAIMGPNGSGKSTLAYVLAGKADYEVTQGEVLFEGEDVLAMDPDERAAKGVVAGASQGDFSFLDSLSLTVGAVDSGLGAGFGNGIMLQGHALTITVAAPGGLTVNRPVTTAASPLRRAR